MQVRHRSIILFANISGRARIALARVRRDNAKALGYFHGGLASHTSEPRTNAAIAVLFGIANSLITPLAGCARRGYARLDV